MALALTGCRIFTGDEFLDDHAVLISGRRIESVVEQSKVANSHEVINLNGGILAPGFIDVQVNGGGGALLNDKPTVETVKQIVEAHRKFGTTGLLPTVITDSPEILSQAMTAVRLARRELPNILGLHIEGPFIDVAKKGAHDGSFIRAMTSADVAQITSCDCGHVLVTVAPNVVSPQFIGDLTQAGVLVSLGHSDANFEQANEALAAGASAFTHLFNAMSQMNGREPGMVGAALSDKKSFIGIIADGFHVDYAAISIAKKIMQHRLFAITDAVTTTTEGYYQHQPDGDKYAAANILSGSALTMYKALQNLVKHVGIETGEALRMCSLYPAQVMQMDDQLGMIASGYKAKMVLLPEGLNNKSIQVIG